MKSVSGFIGTHTCCWSRHIVAIDYWSTARREVPPTVEIISERFGQSVMDQPTDASVPKPNPCRRACRLLWGFGTGGTAERASAGNGEVGSMDGSATTRSAQGGRQRP